MNLRDYQRGRDDGLALAMKLVKEGGVEALYKEVEDRKAFSIHTSLSMAELDKALAPIKARTVSTVCALAVATLMDEFGMGKVRLARFVDRFELKAECILGDLVSWQDLVNDVRERTGIDLELKLVG